MKIQASGAARRAIRRDRAITQALIVASIIGLCAVCYGAGFAHGVSTAFFDLGAMR